MRQEGTHKFFKRDRGIVEDESYLYWYLVDDWVYNHYIDGSVLTLSINKGELHCLELWNSSRLIQEWKSFSLTKLLDRAENIIEYAKTF